MYARGIIGPGPEGAVITGPIPVGDNPILARRHGDGLDKGRRLLGSGRRCWRRDKGVHRKGKDQRRHGQGATRGRATIGKDHSGTELNDLAGRPALGHNAADRDRCPFTNRKIRTNPENCFPLFNNNCRISLAEGSGTRISPRSAIFCRSTPCCTAVGQTELGLRFVLCHNARAPRGRSCARMLRQAVEDSYSGQALE